MQKGNVTALLVAYAALAGCAGRASSAPDIAGVQRASDQLRAAMNAADTIAFLRLLADDLELFPPATAPINGSAAHDLFRGLFKQFALTSSPSVKRSGP
jgi:ketosteroid isomerase-like protein